MLWESSLDEFIIMISAVIYRLDEKLIRLLGRNVYEINMSAVDEGTCSSHTAINYKKKVTW